MTLSRSYTRPMRALALGLALAACGSTATSTTLAPAAAGTVPSDALVLGLRMNFGRFDVLEDGTITDGTETMGRVGADGSLYRADGSLAARVGADGTITLEPPVLVEDDPSFGLRIDGDSLVLTEDGEPHVVASITADEMVVGSGPPRHVDGLTPERHRALLACHAVLVLALAESAGHGYF